MKKHSGKPDDAALDGEQLPGNPVYSPNEDIYARQKRETFNDELTGKEKNIPALPVGADLDVPGAELDDADEIIGEEDEENNYYSLGGDNHEDLEEDRGE